MRQKSVIELNELQDALRWLSRASEALERGKEPMLAQRTAAIRMGIDLALQKAQERGV